jgi:cytochrome c biogenesis protein CcdA
MMEFLLALGSALWLGILTSISPCPLATNIAAVSFLTKRITRPFLVFISGIAYTAGRTLAYALLGWIIINSLLSVPQVAQFLQKYMVKILGPVLIVTGLFLVEIITLKWSGLIISPKNQNRLAETGAPGAFILGILFALAFCPVSAALFFGSLIPLALNNKGGILLPFVYGIGTGLPVFIFALAITLGVTSMSKWVSKIAGLELYIRRLTGIIFILVGLYYTGIYILKLF